MQYIEFCSLATRRLYSATRARGFYILRYWNGEKWIIIDASYIEFYADIPTFVQANLSIGV